MITYESLSLSAVVHHMACDGGLAYYYSVLPNWGHDFLDKISEMKR
jgi:hypothetical protein